MSNRKLEELCDEDLVALVKKGQATESEQALSELLRRYSEGIIRMAYLATRDEALSLDYAQEVLIALAKGVASFRGESKFSTWVYTISRRSIWRSIKKHKKVSLHEVSTDSSSVISKQLSSTSKSQEQQLIAQQQQQQLFAAIDSLPVKQKEAVLLYYYQDCSLEEISSRIGCAANTVKAHLYKARASLAKKLGAKVEDEKVEQNVK